MVFDPGFENAGPFAGDASGWTVTIVNSNWGFAVFQVNGFGLERFEDSWGNDDPIWTFSPTDLQDAEFDPADPDFPILVERFLYWCAPGGGSLCVYLADWTDVIGDAAVFDTVPQDWEDFEEDWGNWPWYPAFVSYIDGQAEEPFTIGETSERFGIRLQRTGFPTFDAVLEATPDTYDTAVALAAHLQALVDAALTAAGGPYAPGDVLFYPAEGRIAIVNTKSLHYMTIYSSTEDGWPTILGRPVTWMDFRWYEEDLLDEAAFAWTGEYNSATYDAEQFERDWFNSDTSAPWDYQFTLVEWNDGTEDPLQGGATVDIVPGVNDSFSFRARVWKTGNVTTSGVLLVPPGSYALPAFVTALQNAINAWLIGAGAPFAAGDLVASVSPSGTIRLSNLSPTPDMVFYLTDQATLLWDFLGMPYEPLSQVEEYIHPTTARWTPVSTVAFATFNGGGDQYEGFEVGWP